MRSKHELEPVCTWCGGPVPTFGYQKTLPQFTAHQGLPSGTGVAVCGPSCPDRPTGAEVGTRFKGETV